LKETDVYNKLEDKYFNGLSINNVLFEGQFSQIKSFDKSISPFTGINELQVITLLEISLKDFNWEALKDKLNLKAIHIERCHLESLEKSGFNSIKDINLIILTIDDSKLKQIEDLTFENWKSLKMLTITKNKDLKDLNWINKQTNFADLWYLDLSDNKIEIIPPNFFSALPKLKVLKLDNNYLKELDWNVLEPVLPHLREFSLYGNLIKYS
jgi:Leucine-rich repeat (LRR) protein